MSDRRTSLQVGVHLHDGTEFKAEPLNQPQYASLPFVVLSIGDPIHYGGVSIFLRDLGQVERLLTTVIEARDLIVAQTAAVQAAVAAVAAEQEADALDWDIAPPTAEVTTA